MSEGPPPVPPSPPPFGTPAAAPPPTALIPGLLALASQLVSWFTTPGQVSWGKWFVALSMALLGVAGAVVWDQRVVLVTVWAATEATADSKIEASRASQALSDLMRVTGASAASVWEYDFSINQRKLVLATTPSGARLLEGLDVMPIQRQGSAVSASVLSALWAGSAPCIQITQDTSADVRSIQNQLGAVVYCISGITSGYGQLKGSVLVFFPHAPADPELVTSSLRSAAAGLLRPH